MLIEFKVGNYRSFRKEQVLRMVATRITEFPENVFTDDVSGADLLKAAVVYGANSSGKSNLLRALGTMKEMLFGSFTLRSSERLPHDPFALDDESPSLPTCFELSFSTEGKTYRYGFEYNGREITEEWLFDATGGEDVPLFMRVQDGIEVFSKHFPEGDNLEERTKNNALFLSVVDQFGGETAGRIIRWFEKLTILDGVHHADNHEQTVRMLEDDQLRDRLVNFYRKLDLGFDDIFVKRLKAYGSQPEDGALLRADGSIVADGGHLADGKRRGDEALLQTKHQMKTKEGEKREVIFNMLLQESAGTNKLVDLSGQIFTTLNVGGTLVVDELDAKLHPMLTMAIIRLFQLETTNPNNAQLIFATHDTKMLSLGRLRRDQIMFAEKGRDEGTRIFTLATYKIDERKVRKDNSFEKDYLQGRYGGVPELGDYTTI